MNTYTAIASPNIAFIKYWGNRDDSLRIPMNDSLSMNLDGLHTITSVQFDDDLDRDTVTINGVAPTAEAYSRVCKHIDYIRSLSGITIKVRVISKNNFPMGSGIASSASSFAALTLAACKAADLELDMRSLSRIARRGSGSACRSIPPGYVIWKSGTTDENSYAESFASIQHWDLVDCIVITSEQHKKIGSSKGHQLAANSLLQPIRLMRSGENVTKCKQAISTMDFALLAEIVEQDSNLMHSVMATSNPKLQYWNQTSFDIMALVHEMRKTGIEACCTLDAGPNAHVITRLPYVDLIEERIRHIPGVLRTIRAQTGDGARMMENPLLT